MSLRATICVALGLFSAADAADRPQRTTVPIGRSWNLTAEKHERTVMDGERTKLLTATGKPVLKHGQNIIKGPWDIEAKADKIECDFVAKKFVISGNPELKHLDPKTGIATRIITGESKSKIEVTFDRKNVSTEGRTTTKAVDFAPLAPPPAKPDGK